MPCVLQCNIGRVCLVEQDEGVGGSGREVDALVCREWDSWINDIEMHEDGSKFLKHI